MGGAFHICVTVTDDVTGRVLGAAICVHRWLGSGYREDIYANALAIELADRRQSFTREASYRVRFRDQEVGLYRPDFVVEQSLVLELKAIQSIALDHVRVMRSYLEVTQLSAGLILNFGEPVLGIRRVLRG